MNLTFIDTMILIFDRETPKMVVYCVNPGSWWLV